MFANKVIKESNGLIHYRIVNELNTSLLNILPLISLEKIEAQTNKFKLKRLEKKYDLFLEKYQQLLLLHNNIDEYLEIRDAIVLKINRLERLETKLGKNNKQSHKPNLLVIPLPPELALNQQQLDEGYILNDTTRFCCGCVLVKYATEKTDKNNKNILLYSYCLHHKTLKKREEMLELELTKIKKELNFISC